MRSVFRAAWRVVVQRSVADRAILVAALITVLLATTLVASGPIYADSVNWSAVQRTLADSGVRDSNVRVTARTYAEGYPELADEIVAELGRTFSLTGGEQYESGRSDSFSIIDEDTTNDTNLVVLGWYAGLQEHTALSDGRWPQPNEDQAAVISVAAATQLGLSIGDEVSVANRRDMTSVHTLQLVGTYTPNSSSDPYWWDEQLELDGIQLGTNFNTLGPFVVDRETFYRITAPFTSSVEWRVAPNHQNMEIDEISGVLGRLSSVKARLNAGREIDNQIELETGLPGILRTTQTSLLATRSSVFLLTTQLAVLAGYALLLTAGLLSDSRQIETVLMRSRGAGQKQLLAMGTMEGLLLTIPAAVAAPTLAAWMLRLFNIAGPLHDIGLTIDPAPTPESLLLSLAAGVGCLVALLIPVFRNSKDGSGVRARRSRGRLGGIWQKAGADIVLLAGAGLAFWQLKTYGAPVTEDLEGRLGVDPLLIAAPTLGLIAGGIVALRTVPLLSRLAQYLANRSRKAVSALSAWQLARRPTRYSRSALLLILAIGLGLFSLGYQTTWRRSQVDQASFQVGADVLVEPNRRAGEAIPGELLTVGYQQLESVDTAVPIIAGEGRLPTSDARVSFRIVDSETAASIVSDRGDLSREPLSEILGRLTDGRPILPSIPIPGEPTTAFVTTRMESVPLLTNEDTDLSAIERYEPTLRLVMVDGLGKIFRVDMGRIEDWSEPSAVGMPLNQRFGDRTLTPTYPLAFLGFEIRSPTPRDFVRTGSFAIEEIRFGTEATSNPLDIDLSPSEWDIQYVSQRLPIELADFTPDNASPGLSINLVSGLTRADDQTPSYLQILAPGSVVDSAIPVIASEGLLEELNLKIGDTFSLETLPGLTGNGVITGSVDAFPTVDPLSGGVLVLDYQTYLAASLRPGFIPAEPNQWWLDTHEGNLSAVPIEDQLLAEPFVSSSATSAVGRAAQLGSDPVALGTIASLLMGFIAAAVFASVGFTINFAFSARERMGEFALLRAVGLSRKQLVRTLAIENLSLILVGLVGGTTLGLLLGNLALPLVSITQGAVAAFPPVVVEYPWGTILGFDLLLLVILTITIAFASSVLREQSLGTELRRGDR